MVFTESNGFIHHKNMMPPNIESLARSSKKRWLFRSDFVQMENGLTFDQAKQLNGLRGQMIDQSV